MNIFAPEFVIYISPSGIEIWKKKASMALLAAISAFDNAELNKTIGMHIPRNARAALLINLPDIIIQTESLPRTGFLDQKKIVARRLDFVFPNHDIKTARLIDKRRNTYSFVAISNNDKLRALFTALAEYRISISTICHAGCELLSLIPARMRNKHTISLARLQDEIILTFSEGKNILLTRSIPDIPPSLVAEEIKRSLSYLQRHSWNFSTTVSVFGFGVNIDAPSLMPYNASSIRNIQTNAHQKIIEGMFVGQTPFLPLRSEKLARLKKLMDIKSIRWSTGWIAAGIGFTSLILYIFY